MSDDDKELMLAEALVVDALRLKNADGEEALPTDFDEDFVALQITFAESKCSLWVSTTHVDLEDEEFFEVLIKGRDHRGEKDAKRTHVTLQGAYVLAVADFLELIPHQEIKPPTMSELNFDDI